MIELSSAFRLRAFAVALLLTGIGFSAEGAEIGPVVHVVDGDTIRVEIEGVTETVRLIGVDTPETVHPQKPVEYFGREASVFLRDLVLSRTVRLEKDPGTANRGRYGRNGRGGHHR